MMTWSLQSQSCTELRDIFLQMDKSKSGVVTYEEFTDALSDVNITGTDIFKMFHALDSNADGKIEYSEFVAALAAQELSGSEEKISDAFGRFDTAGTGFLTVDSLGEVLGAKDAEEVKTFVAEADVHGDGMVGFDTFLGYMKQEFCAICGTRSRLRSGPRRRSPSQTVWFVHLVDRTRNTFVAL